MIRCQNCGHLNSNDDKFCGECGNKLSEPANYCPNCDITFYNLNKFCTQCGTKLVVKSGYLKSKSLNKNRNNIKNSQPQNGGDKNPNYIKRNYNPAPPDNFLENLIATSKVKQKINTKDSVIIDIDMENYSHLSNDELLHMWETARDNRRHAQKSGDISAQEQLNRQIGSLEAELYKRGIYPY